MITRYVLRWENVMNKRLSRRYDSPYDFEENYDCDETRQMKIRIHVMFKGTSLFITLCDIFCVERLLTVHGLLFELLLFFVPLIVHASRSPHKNESGSRHFLASQGFPV